MNTLWLATGNKKKVEELRAMLTGQSVTILTVQDLKQPFGVVEDGDTFLDNAKKKAVALAALTGSWCLADDSGLEVDALDGRPGVRSARFAGEPSSDLKNNDLLLHLLTGETNRRARFRCVLYLTDGQTHYQTSGVVNGHISHQPAGSGGFGYDPLFIPDGYQSSFAELGSDVKNTLSHRAMALREMLPILTRLFA